MDRTALCPGAFGNPRRIRSGLPRSTITKPVTYMEVTLDLVVSAELEANAEAPIMDAALAPPRTLRNSRRFIRFIRTPSLGCLKDGTYALSPRAKAALLNVIRREM